jgi:hypothetical protein
MIVKLLMTWDIRPDKEAEYFEFIMKEFSPGLTRMGIQPAEAWYTIYGEGPQILTGAVAEDVDTVRSALKSEDWRKLKAKLLELVENYHQKVIPTTGRFQL